MTFVTFRAGDADRREVWSKRADGTGEAEPLYGGEGYAVEALWSPDGQWLVVRTGGVFGGVNTRDILALRPGVDSVALPLLAEAYDEVQPALSPDGRWIAYVSRESGRNEVYVRPFPNVDAGKWQVSTDGAVMPVWSHSGSELFFVDGDRRLIAAQIGTDSGFRVGEKRCSRFHLRSESARRTLSTASPRTTSDS